MSRLNIDVVTKNILNKCKEKNYEFLGFCNKEGNVCDYKNVDDTFLCLKCNICGNIWKTTSYYNFVKNNVGCVNCKKKKLSEINKISLKIILNDINKLCKIKNYEFIYFCDKEGNKCEYNGVKTKMKLKCNNCGNIWRTTSVYTFLKLKRGCSECYKKSETNELDFVLKNIEDRCNEDDYTFLGFCDKDGNESEYINNQTKLIIQCNKCGKIWKTPSYNSFISKKVNCPNCKTYSLETTISKMLKENNIKFSNNNRKILKGLELDFYLPHNNIAIECQGRQHFSAIDAWGGEEELNIQKERDERKRKLCEEKGIKLFYYSNLHINYPYKVYENENELLDEIKKVRQN